MEKKHTPTFNWQRIFLEINNEAKERSKKRGKNSDEKMLVQMQPQCVLAAANVPHIEIHLNESLRSKYDNKK